ncbi:hypothetical protein [Costertonia aggregata]|uniref:Uncharacterized protein n=1 Tax=Costertonia aggregata TaxID=343403 RepID=A0A7H9AS96_9FLAO|nr:hypothetical protein [Costertonia aggregata]QLG46277.1 hypothetical protein HYG79_13290 [Costertonia aggregata]
MKTTLFFSLFMLLSVSRSFSQDVNLFIKSVKEERHSDQNDSFLELEASINGIKINENNQVKIHEISLAKDDLENILEKKESFFGDDYRSDNDITIKLDAPFRNAKKLALVQGTFKFYNPTVENKGKVVFDKFLENYNTNILKGHSSDAKLTLVNKEEMDRLKKEDKKQYKKELEKLKSEGALPEGMAETLDAFTTMFEGMFSFGTSKESLTFIKDDPNEKIVEILVYNEKDEKMNFGYSNMGSTSTISLREVPQNTWRLEILLENDKAVKLMKFKLNDILLP